MSIPPTIKVKHGKLPTGPGVYLFKDKKGKVVYVGKATNLRSRVSAYFAGVAPERARRRSLSAATPRYTRTINEMLHYVKQIDYVTTDSVIEALILEANLIRKYMPRYNVKEKDDRSFLYVVVTKEEWPKPQLIRGNELRAIGYSLFDIRSNSKSLIANSRFQKVFGPYTSASAIRAALDLIRKWFPWSTCKSLRTTSYVLRPRPCFDYHIGRCPGVCIGAITRREYMKNIRNVILMLEGKKAKVMKNVELRMKNAAKAERFEEAEMLKRKLFALQHIRDVAVLKAELWSGKSSALKPSEAKLLPQAQHKSLASSIDILGRIEGYDISNISGTSAVGSMVVFEDGEAKKSEYKRFCIKTVRGINDVAMMSEILRRRFRRIRNYESGIMKSKNHDSLFMLHDSQIWKLPDLLVIDGGWGQVHAAKEVIDDMRRLGLRLRRRPSLPNIPIVGIAKGFKRKQDRPIFDEDNPELARIVENYKDLLLRVRDEAHRFAVAYHRKMMRLRN